MTHAERYPVPPGTNIGVYRIERVLGRGGMGTVYLAYDTTLHRQVALKVVTDPAESGASRATVLREARNAAALNFPNICTIYEVGEAEGSAFIAMEYVEGSSLRDRIDRGAYRWSKRSAMRSRPPMRWRTRTTAESSTATSRRPTQSSPATGD